VSAGRQRAARPGRGLAWLAAVFVVGAVSAACAQDERVERVLDGDSIVLAGGREVRYLGINAPESGEPFSAAARALNRRLVEGKRVHLVHDREQRDGYGRLLAYVYVGDTFVNGELLASGLAHVFLFGPLREEAALAARERAARTARRGIWAAATGPLRITAPRGTRRGGARRDLRAITICNVSGDAVDLEGFMLRVDEGRFRFPRARLDAGHVAVVVRGAGRDRRSGPGALRLHWDVGDAGTRRPGQISLVSPTGAAVDEVRLDTGPAAGERGAGPWRRRGTRGPSGAPAPAPCTDRRCAA
jgi:endonuclease YncB( thermonuclease family)